MIEDFKTYVSPFSGRYASEEMKYLFSDDHKFKTFRKLWIYLAEAEKELGLNITKEQIRELKEHADDLNLDVAREKEKEIRHDVMAQIYAYGVQCPAAKGIIHLGATSCYVDDNTDVLILKDAMNILLKKGVQVLKNLRDFAEKYKEMPCLAYTHLQPAQLTTVGKRASLWIYDLLLNLRELDHQISILKPLGCKGATGTQASFFNLFEGDYQKVKALDEKIIEKMGFKSSVPVSGQTYTRVQDSYILDCLKNIASSGYKFAQDLRVLQSFREFGEPLEKKQVGSSAMPYKRNPMRSERLCGIARYVMVNAQNGTFTASSQFLERTLDDSSNRRLSLSEMFLGVDSILNLYINITDGIVVNSKIIENRVREELPFMATENIMMEGVKRGGDRQALHEIIRVCSRKAQAEIEGGRANHLLDYLEQEKAFSMTKEEMENILNPKEFTGFASHQTDSFLREEVDPFLKEHREEDVVVEITL